MAPINRDKVLTAVEATHQYYMNILNAIPSIVYWIDLQCHLKGCTHAFVEWLGLKSIHDFSGTPYQKMEQFTTWPKERINAFRLDDMKALFSGVAQHEVLESPVVTSNGEVLHYRATRMPLCNEDKQVTGLVVILTEMPVVPLQVASLAIEKPVMNGPSRTLGRETRVLMVEDDPVAQEVESALLSELDCRVDVAESGDKAMSLFSPGKYDIVFMDIGLQDTSGYVVAKKMRQMEKNTKHRVPIIALTTYQAEVVQSDCVEYCMDGVLTKPMNAQQAQQIIQHYIFHEAVVVNGLHGE